MTKLIGSVNSIAIKAVSVAWIVDGKDAGMNSKGKRARSVTAAAATNTKQLQPMISKARASAELSLMLHPGDTICIVLRGPSRRKNTIVDFIILPQAHIGEYMAALLDQPFLYSYKGMLLRKGQLAEGVIENLSRELFGQYNQLKSTWL